MKFKIRFLVILFLCAIFPACEENNNNDPKVDRITHGDCKPGTKSSENTESIEYTTVDKNYLSVKHVNVLFNCEPGQLVVDVELQDDTIFVNENEKQSIVNCICPYDLSYRIGPLSYGNYQFVLLQGGLQRTQFLIDFNSTTEGVIEINTK